MQTRRPKWLAMIGLAALACGGSTAQQQPAPAAAPAPDRQAAHRHGGRHEDNWSEDGHGHGPLGHRFEDAERWAREFDDPARDAWQKPTEVVRLLAIEPGMTVADLGAGTGYFMKYLSNAVGPEGHVLALDVEPSMIDYMRRRAEHEGLTNVEPRVVPFDDPAMAAGSVHRVLIVDTWHHIPDRIVYSGKLLAALAPGGTVTVVDFTLDAPHGPPAHARIPPEEVVRELSAAGFRAEVVPEDLPHQYVVRATKP